MPDFMSLKKVWGKLDSGGADQQGPKGPYSQGIGNTAAAGPVYTQDDRVARVNMILRALQVFFGLVTLLIAVYMATFQSKWVGSPSGLTGLLLFLASASLLASAIFLAVPIIYERSGYKYMKSFTRALSEARVGMVCNGVFVFLILILAMTQTISAYTSAGCKDPKKDPHAGGKDRATFVDQLGGWCRTKRAEAAFCWFLWVTWFLSLLLFLRQWRLERKNGPRIPPFVHPNEDSAFEPIHDLDDEDAFDETAKTARYGDGGNGRYGVASSGNAGGGKPNMASYDRRGSNPLADIEAKYGMSPAYTADPFADGRSAAPEYSRPSYDYNAYGSEHVPGGCAPDPYRAINHQLSSGRGSDRPPQLPSLGYGYH